MQTPPRSGHRVTIIGGGFGGLYAARRLGRDPRVDITLVDRRNHHGVTNIGWLGPFGRTGGFIAWLLWLGIHITYLIGFANRLVVLTRWVWSFVTHGRGNRLITGQPLLPDIADPEPPA